MTSRDEMLRLYVEESLEHLADIETDLLAIEAGGAQLDDGLVNKVFRAAHSIKGAAGFLGLQTINELAHRLEDALGRVRGREIVPTTAVVNVLLQGFDRLRELVCAAGESDGADISEHTAALDGLAGARKARERQPSAPLGPGGPPCGAGLFSASEPELAEATRGGKFLYVLEYDLLGDVHARGRSPGDAFAVLEGGGTVLDCRVDAGSAGTLEDGAGSERLPLWVLYATVLDWDLIEDVLEIPRAQIRRVTPAEFRATAVPVEVGSGPVPEAAPAPGRPAPAAPSATASASRVDTSLRVSVELLDKLMALAGELVLGRNQLLRAEPSGSTSALKAAAQRIDAVTSELQEAIMLTRMQPVGHLFNKFPRLVRDLANKLGKQVRLDLVGGDVELDKAIVEGLSDPLTHLVRNAVDHGIETPLARASRGKEAAGVVVLRAYHEAGQVHLEITDDGGGLDPEKLASAAVARGLLRQEQAAALSAKEKMNLIFLPGFSTAEAVTDVSGRGVGMDVVKTNLTRLGGSVVVDSEPGAGTSVQIRLPLTLAIIPSQLVLAGGLRFAIPQVNMEELVRIPASRVKESLERVGDAEVVRRRGRLLPLLRLAAVLGLEALYVDPVEGQARPDRRRNLADRRAAPLPEDRPEARSGAERRFHAASALSIVIVSAGAFRYGLVVDEPLDAEEIVVKPLGRHLKGCQAYAGATILGDGQVALILDAAGLARAASLACLEATDGREAAPPAAGAELGGSAEALLLFRGAADEQLAVPLEVVTRIERVAASAVDRLGGRPVLKYRGGLLPLVSADGGALLDGASEDLVVLVMTLGSRAVGLVGRGPVDSAHGHVLHEPAGAVAGVFGSSIVEGRATLVIDALALARRAHPEWFPADREAVRGTETLLLAEDSAFFRHQVAGVLSEHGYRVLEAPDGAAAWELLEARGDEVSLVLTDIEMPRLNGLGFTRKIRASRRFARLPVVALTTLSAEADRARGLAAGVDDYQVKLDVDRLLLAVRALLPASDDHRRVGAEAQEFRQSCGSP